MKSKTNRELIITLDFPLHTLNGLQIQSFTQSKNNEIDKRVLLYFLEDEMLEKLYLFFKKDTKTFLRVIDINNKELILSKVDIVLFMKKLDISILNTRQIMFIQEITKLTDINALLRHYASEIYSTKVGNRVLVMPVLNLLSYLVADKQSFQKFLNKGVEKSFLIDSNTSATNLEIAYLLVSFIESESIIDKYNFDPFYSRYLLLKNKRMLNFENFEKDNSTSFENIEINSKLYEKIISVVKPEYSSVEVAIYIYFKMCDILTYDPEYYVANHLDPIRKKHQDFSHLLEITPINNTVVCYEFIYIYAKILSGYGISCKVDDETAYGNSHMDMTFKADGFHIHTDPLAGIIYNDMSSAKLNLPLKGLFSINVDSNKMIAFEQLFSNLYANYVQEKEDSISFEDALIQYKAECSHVFLTNQERFYLFLQAIKRDDLRGIDYISYQKRVIDYLFSACPEVDISFIRKSLYEENEYIFRPLILFSLILKTDIYYYAIDTETKEIKKLNLEELKARFSSGEYSYMSESKDIIGIERFEPLSQKAFSI